MPVPALPANNTARGLVQYTAAGQPHVMQVRFGVGVTKSDAAEAISDLLDRCKNLMLTADSITGGLWIPALADISQPWDINGGPGTVGGSPDGVIDYGRFGSAVGRGDTGHKVRITWFFPMIPDSYGVRQLPSALSLAWQDWYAEATGSAVGAKDISGSTPVWKPYINIGVNAHQQRAAR